MNADDLFVRYFWPLYPPDVRADLSLARATDANPAGNRAILSSLSDAADHFAVHARLLFGADLALDRTDASIHRLGAAMTIERRDAWASTGAEGTAESLLFNAVVHGAAYVGECVVASHAGVWQVRRPLWESFVRLRSRAGEGDLPVFHWMLKSLSSDALTARDGSAASLADRYRAFVEVPCESPERRPIIIQKARPLPRLHHPTYDLLHKYMRAHLPELRDLGRDFPTAERFAAFALRWLDFHVIGGGRGVLLAGACDVGLHLFWLGEHGFDKATFMAGDRIPEPVVRIAGDRITAMTSQRGQSNTQEILWWGP